MQKESARKYFDLVAAEYEQAWGDPAVTYPLVKLRSEYAVRWFLGWLSTGRSAVLDLGCGTGYFLELAFEAGYQGHGVDISPRMVERAKERFARKRFQPSVPKVEVGDATHWESQSQFDGAVALGLLEYLQSDEEILRTASRLLRPDGGLIVECRNRLFNLISLNKYTREVLESGEYVELLDEFEKLAKFRLLRQFGELKNTLVEELRKSFDGFSSNVKKAVESVASPQCPTEAYETLPRRQHTPLRLATTARRFGLNMVYLRFLHLHPFAPVFEKEAPDMFRRLGIALDVLGETPIAATMSSSFLAGFRKRKEIS